MIELGLTLTESHKKNISESKKGTKFGGALYGANRGKPAWNRGKKMPIRECEICGKNVPINIYHQFHSSNCKKIQ